MSTERVHQVTHDLITAAMHSDLKLALKIATDVEREDTVWVMLALAAMLKSQMAMTLELCGFEGEPIDIWRRFLLSEQQGDET